MRIYAESSAVLSWLFGEAMGETGRQHLTVAESVFTSVLTFVECERALVRARTVETIAAPAVAERRRVLTSVGAHWHRVPVRDEVLDRAKRPFPVEPVRTLDAVHLASAVLVRSAVPDLRMLSFDRRVREAAAGLGFDVVP